MTAKHAMIPGTFDPVTCGHLDIVTRALRLFDQVTLAVADGGRHTLFSHARRLELARAAVAELDDGARCRVAGFSGLLVDAVRAEGCQVVIRGVRGPADLDHEWPMAAMNHRLDPDFEAAFLPARPELSMLSATIVRDVARCGGELAGLVPAVVAAALRERFAEAD
ncbi:MAG TPA: pantetheine-phosphate adenylyltransferase [Candidatus Krumholzibacteria bacterium]|nr:pantetheine-phosphate adenylyltransferase [Candidatus Krumholzibacteria bacterium]HRX50676.1 pantetheine-phosphate adenylyltransferase [Candidatus Krumholzibacteria bacterium]